MLLQMVGFVFLWLNNIPLSICTTSGISQVETDKYQMISLIWGSTKKKLKEQNGRRNTEPKNGVTVTKEKGTGVDALPREGEGWGKDRGPYDSHL